ncbi:MAG: aldo/keto reductase, partial [Candidatus Binatia bacterium]
AWVLARGKDFVPIPGTTRRKHLEENVGALPVELSVADLAAIDEVAPKGAASGDRYDAVGMRFVNQ